MKDWTYYESLQRDLFEANPYKTTNGAVCNLFLSALEGMTLGSRDADDYLGYVVNYLEMKVERAKHWGGQPRDWVAWLYQYVSDGYYCEKPENWTPVCNMITWAIEWQQLSSDERSEIKRLKSWNKLSDEEKALIQRNKNNRTNTGLTWGELRGAK